MLNVDVLERTLSPDAMLDSEEVRLLMIAYRALIDLPLTIREVKLLGGVKDLMKEAAVAKE